MSWVIVEHEGRRERIAIVRSPEGTWVKWNGNTALIEDEREIAVDGSMQNDVRAPMTGKIIKMAVAVGTDVEADDLLVVMEAMKMEYRLTAPRAGRVEAVSCKEGDLVDLGATLVSLEA